MSTDRGPGVICPECETAYRLPEGADGKKFKCKQCGHVIRVPASEQPPEIEGQAQPLNVWDPANGPKRIFRFRKWFWLPIGAGAAAAGFGIIALVAYMVLPSSDPLARGFRGVKWGEELAKRKDMIALPREGKSGLHMYVRTDADQLNAAIGEAKVVIGYHVHRGRFFRTSIYPESAADFLHLRRAAFMKFGELTERTPEEIKSMLMKRGVLEDEAQFGLSTFATWYEDVRGPVTIRLVLFDLDSSIAKTYPGVLVIEHTDMADDHHASERKAKRRDILADF